MSNEPHDCPGCAWCDGTEEERKAAADNIRKHTAQWMSENDNQMTAEDVEKYLATVDLVNIINGER